MNQPQSQTGMPYLPELINAQEMMNDIALRVQQIIIGMDVYDNQLQKVHEALPGFLSQGVETKELPFFWSTQKDAKTLQENLKRSITFTLLNSLNMHIYNVDGFMKAVLIKYYGYNPEDTSWFTPDIFSAITEIDMTKVKNFQTLKDLREMMEKFRSCQMTRSISTNEYFNIYGEMNIFLNELSLFIIEHVKETEAKKNEGTSDNGN